MKKLWTNIHLENTIYTLEKEFTKDMIKTKEINGESYTYIPVNYNGKN